MKKNRMICNTTTLLPTEHLSSRTHFFPFTSFFFFMNSFWEHFDQLNSKCECHWIWHRWMISPSKTKENPKKKMNILKNFEYLFFSCFHCPDGTSMKVKLWMGHHGSVSDETHTQKDDNKHITLKRYGVVVI